MCKVYRKLISILYNLLDQARRKMQDGAELRGETTGEVHAAEEGREEGRKEREWEDKGVRRGRWMDESNIGRERGRWRNKIKGDRKRRKTCGEVNIRREREEERGRKTRWEGG